MEREIVQAFSDGAEQVDHIRADTVRPRPDHSALHALQNQLFNEEVSASADATGVTFFSASGEALECVEIARRIMAAKVPFDSCAVLLRSPGRYQPLLEDAFRRAGISAWFTHGAVRPDSAGRSFLALLHCAEEGLTASRFGEYPSHKQKEHPYGWEKLVVDASVIGGSARWKRRLEGLPADIQNRLGEATLLAFLFLTLPAFADLLPNGVLVVGAGYCGWHGRLDAFLRVDDVTIVGPKDLAGCIVAGDPIDPLPVAVPLPAPFCAYFRRIAARTRHPAKAPARLGDR